MNLQLHATKPVNPITLNFFKSRQKYPHFVGKVIRSSALEVWCIKWPLIMNDIWNENAKEQDGKSVKANLKITKLQLNSKILYKYHRYLDW